MLRCLLVPVVLLALALSAPAAHADDPYTPGLPTSCNIDGALGPDGSGQVTMSVTANSATPPTGSVRIDATSGRRAPQAQVAAASWTKTVRYEGTPVTVNVPDLPGRGYLVAMTFTPDGNLFTSCNDAVALEYDGGRIDGNNGTDGVLPDTGGPSWLWLLLASILVAIGSGSIALSRRRVVI